MLSTRPRTRSLPGVEGNTCMVDPIIKGLLLDKKYSLLSSIVSVDPDFGVGGNQLLQKHITTFYTHHGSIHFVLKHFFKEEVNQTKEKSTLFRGISIATAILAEYFYKQAHQYIQKLTKPLVSAICAHDERCWEINPETTIDTKQCNLNIDDIKMLTTVFLDRIFDNERTLPISITAILSIIRQEIINKFGDTAEDVLPAFFFLRFICPVIVSPERFGILSKPPSTSARRGLVLITKILQQLACKEEFQEEKEAYMCDFNMLLRCYHGRFARFSKLISKYNSTKESELNIQEEVPIQQTEYEESTSYIRNFVITNFPQICDKVETKDREIAIALRREYGKSESDTRGKSLDTQEKLTLSSERKMTKLFTARKHFKSKKLKAVDIDLFTTNEEYSVDLVGQLIILKELLQEETRNRDIVEEELKKASEKLEQMEIDKNVGNKCN